MKCSLVQFELLLTLHDALHRIRSLGDAVVILVGLVLVIDWRLEERGCFRRRGGCGRRRGRRRPCRQHPSSLARTRCSDSRGGKSGFLGDCSGRDARRRRPHGGVRTRQTVRHVLKQMKSYIFLLWQTINKTRFVKLCNCLSKGGARVAYSAFCRRLKR